MTYKITRRTFGLEGARPIKEETNKMDTRTSPKELIRFIGLINTLSATEFLGVVRVMNLTVIGENNKSRSFEDIMSDMIDKFIEYNRTQRRNLIKIIKKASQCK